MLITQRSLEDLHSVYPGRVTSTTVPAQHQPNVRLANTRHPITGVVFDQRGLPIFDPHANVDLRIERSVAQVKDRTVHYRGATQELQKLIDRGQVSGSSFTSVQLQQIRAGKPYIDDLTWHHHQDIGRMQLIPYTIHSETKHVGGFHLWFQGGQQ